MEMGFKFQIVLADSLYGESGDFIEALNHNQLNLLSLSGVTTVSWCLRGREFDTLRGKV